MKAKAISFTPEVLKAKLRALEEYGRCMTRRRIGGTVAPNQWPATESGDGRVWVDPAHKYGWVRPPFGLSGQRLWIRERALVTKFLPFTDSGPKVTLRYEVDGAESGWVAYPPRLREPRVGHCIPNGVHSEGARHFLEVVEVRAELVAEISEEDARLEGMDGSEEFLATSFFALYDSIYGAGAHVCEWVWVYTLKRAAR
jgi:hypothetical protein